MTVSESKHDIEELLKDNNAEGCPYYEALLKAKEALELLEKQEKYKWHSLRKNPNDVPKEGVQVLIYGWNYHFVLGKYGEFRDGDGEYIGFVKNDAWSWNEKIRDVISWRYIEPFEEGDTE